MQHLNLPIDESPSRNWNYLSNNDFGITNHDNPKAYRANPQLIKAIELIGLKEASGFYATLEIVEIPDDVDWRIEDYDGIEWIAEKHRIWH